MKPHLTKYDYQQILKAYTSTCCRVNMKYQLQFERIKDQGVYILQSLAQQYLQSKKNQQEKMKSQNTHLNKKTCLSTNENNLFQIKKISQNDSEGQKTVFNINGFVSDGKKNSDYKPPIIIAKKEAIEEEFTFSTPHKGIHFHKKNKNKTFGNVNLNNHQDNEDKLTYEMKKMSIENKFSFGTAKQNHLHKSFKSQKLIQHNQHENQNQNNQIQKKDYEEQQLTINLPNFGKSQKKPISMYEIGHSNKQFLEDEVETNNQCFNQKNNQEEKFESSDEDPQINSQLIKNKSLFEIIQSTNKKVKKSAQNSQTSLTQIPQDQFYSRTPDVSYPLTDYSSNQSSNDEYYPQHYGPDDSNSMDFEHLQNDMKSSKPLFNGNSLTQSSSSISNNGSLTFVPYQDSQLLKSAKKSVKSKRLYIKNKKIPRWAENMNKLKQIAIQQQTRINPINLYGNITVEMVDSNKIFDLHEAYRRNSSAKWRTRSLFVV